MMRKLFTLFVLLTVAVLAANAQDRKTWDFTKGFKATTIANLTADETNWTASEGSGRKWFESKKRTGGTEISCTVNGETWIVPETQGLIFHASSAKHLNVVYDGGTNDDTHIWLNGAKGEDAVTIPGVPAGDSLVVVFSSHGGNAERGFKVSTSGVSDINGATTFASGGQSRVVLFNNNETAVDVKLSANVGGMHFYYFQIGEGDTVAPAQMAYITDASVKPIEDDNVYQLLSQREGDEVTVFDLSTQTINPEQLRDFKVTIIGPTVDVSKAAVLKEALSWTPILCLNASIVAEWGYAEVETTAAFARINETKSQMFTDVELETSEEEGSVLILAESGFDAQAEALRLSSYFDGDDVLAVTMDEEDPATFIHTHNITHNGYIYFPYVPDYTAAAAQALNNAVDMLADSKADVTAAAMPTLKLEYKDLNTNIIMTAPKLPKAQVYYTLDGTDPDTGSLLYDEPVNVTTETVVKAVAIAEGYTLSSVSEITADIRTQPKTPVISWSMVEDGKTKVTLSCESEDADIFYNITNTTDTLASSKYTGEPFYINMPQTVTAFSVTGGMVFSEPVSERVLVKNPRVVIDVASHFAALRWDGNNPDSLTVANGKGMFSWGASAATQWLGEGTEETVVDPETGDETTVTVHTDADLRPYEIRNEPLDEPQWALYSRGECLVWQTNTPDNKDIGNNEGGYHPSVAEDIDELFPVSNYDVQFYKLFSGEQPNADIRTIDKYTAPLDVVVLANMQGGNLLVQVSTDNENWIAVGDTINPTGNSRMWNKFTRSYDVEGDVYVRLAHVAGGTGAKIFDIYIANQGEKSNALIAEIQQEFDQYMSGIEEVRHTLTATKGIYNLNGVRLPAMQRGLNIVVESDGTVKKVLMK